MDRMGRWKITVFVYYFDVLYKKNIKDQILKIQTHIFNI